MHDQRRKKQGEKKRVNESCDKNKSTSIRYLNLRKSKQIILNKNDLNYVIYILRRIKWKNLQCPRGYSIM